MTVGKSLVEDMASYIRRARFERTGRGLAYDPNLPLHETELADAAAAFAFLKNRMASDDRELVETLNAHASDMEKIMPIAAARMRHAADRITAYSASRDEP